MYWWIRLAVTNPVTKSSLNLSTVFKYLWVEPRVKQKGEVGQRLMNVIVNQKCSVGLQVS